MTYIPNKTATGWKYYQAGVNGTDEMRLLTDLLGALRDPEVNVGRPVVQTAYMTITTGATDSIDFSAFAGTVPIAIVGKKASDDTFENIVTAGSNNFTLTAANDFDALLITNQGINLTSLAQSFRLQNTLTGAGTSATFDTGKYSAVIYYYIYTGAAESSYPATFITAAGVDTYYSSALLGIGNVWVVYGQMVLDSSQYTLITGAITLNVGAVEAGKQLVIIPADADFIIDTVEGQSQYECPIVGSIALLLYAQQPLDASQYTLNGQNIILDFETGGGSQLIIVPSGGAIQRNTVGGQSAYSMPELNGVIPALVIYGQMILEPAMYSIDGPEITINPGGAVESGHKLSIIPKI